MIENAKFVPQLSDDKWILALPFIAEITAHFNKLNVKLQRKGKLQSGKLADVNAFEMTWKLLRKHINKQNFDHFPSCKSLWNISSSQFNA
jgi:hypothetical protein